MCLFDWTIRQILPAFVRVPTGGRTPSGSSDTLSLWTQSAGPL